LEALHGQAVLRTAERLSTNQPTLVLWSKLTIVQPFNLDFWQESNKKGQGTQDVAGGERGIRRHWFVDAKLNQLRGSMFLAAPLAARWARKTCGGHLLFLEGFLKRRRGPMALGMWRMVPWLSIAALKRDAAVHEIFGAQGPESRNEEQRS